MNKPIDSPRFIQAAQKLIDYLKEEGFWSRVVASTMPWKELKLLQYHRPFVLKQLRNDTLMQIVETQAIKGREEQQVS